MRETLLERAKPELKKAIATFGIDYPNSAEAIQKSLSETIGVSFLPYGVVLDLRSIAFRAKLRFDISNPWEWFED